MKNEPVSTQKSIVLWFCKRMVLLSLLYTIYNNNTLSAQAVSVMEFFNRAKAVRLRSLMDKYLTADEDEENVHQSRNGSSHLARWTVELVHGHSHLIRLRSAYGLYLTVTDEPVLLGVTGRKVIQAKFSARGLLDNTAVQWEPIKEGVYVKLRCKAGGKFLRGNGGAPPWRNTVTYDLPHRTATQDWILWGVDVVEIIELDHLSGSSSHLSSLSSCASDQVSAQDGEPNSPTVPDSTGEPKKPSSSLSIRALRRKQSGDSGSSKDMDSPSMASRATSMFGKTFKSSMKALRDSGSPGRAAGTFSMTSAFKRKDHMKQHSMADTGSPTSLRESNRSESSLELFSNARTVRFRGQHNKYLVAKEDDEAVHQGRQGSSRAARWTVEFVEGTGMIRLRSCYGKYLTASEEPFLLGMTGKKVLQTSPEKLDSSVQWEPFREGMQVKLKTRYGNFLRANRGPPPWRNTVTHDIPHRTATQDWILWDVEILEIIPMHGSSLPENETEAEAEAASEKAVSRTNSTASEKDMPYSSESGSESEPMPAVPCHNLSTLEISRSFQSEGRLICYNVVEKDTDADDIVEGPSFHFKGKGLEELKEILAEKTGMQDFTLCSRNAFNGQLYPIKLQLPPNNASMHVFLVPSSSQS
uniref:Actin cross-linking n=1 Tax=Kalanchoe fedtschenkoi TaxID=63787 RepID=A0A7N0T6Q8_KALFE